MICTAAEVTALLREAGLTSAASLSTRLVAWKAITDTIQYQNNRDHFIPENTVKAFVERNTLICGCPLQNGPSAPINIFLPVYSC